MKFLQLRQQQFAKRYAASWSESALEWMTPERSSCQGPDFQPQTEWPVRWDFINPARKYWNHWNSSSSRGEKSTRNALDSVVNRIPAIQMLSANYDGVFISSVSHVSRPYLNWPNFVWIGWQWMPREGISLSWLQVATNRNEVRRAVLSDWSQPRQTGSLHSALTATQFRYKNEFSWDEVW